jgi:hypothetical protein
MWPTIGLMIFPKFKVIEICRKVPIAIYPILILSHAANFIINKDLSIRIGYHKYLDFIQTKIILLLYLFQPA